MKIHVYTEEEFNNNLSILQPDVEYKFFIDNIYEKISGAGNEMVVVELRPNVSGIDFNIKEYFLSADSTDEKINCRRMKKVEKFCRSINIPYTENVFDTLEKLKNKEGTFVLRRQKSNNKYWEVKNFVENSPETNNTLETSKFDDDKDLPF